MRTAKWTLWLALFLPATPALAGTQDLPAPPQSVVLGALCAHAGRHFTTHWHRGTRAQYSLFGHVYYLSHDTYDDIPHGPNGADGEGPWPGVVGGLYGGGLSFMVGTWNNAAKLSSGRLPFVSDTFQIAAQPVSSQVYAMWMIVRQDHDWHEWPNTARECGLPT